MHRVNPLLRDHLPMNSFMLPVLNGVVVLFRHESEMLYQPCPDVVPDVIHAFLLWFILKGITFSRFASFGLNHRRASFGNTSRRTYRASAVAGVLPSSLATWPMLWIIASR